MIQRDEVGVGASAYRNNREENVTTVEDIRNALKARYPDVDDDQFSIEHSGFAHEHPMTAIGVVLISSVLLGTTDVDRLAEFTRYSKQFVRALSSNMDNSRLWKDGKYYCDAWSRNSLLPCDEKQDQEFWEHIEIASGSLWTTDARSLSSVDTCTVFWDLKLVN